jgi:LacI family transcriptional regulator
VGAIGAQILVRMMTEPDARIAESTVLPVELVERDSVSEIQPG